MSEVTLDPRAMFEQIAGAFDHASDEMLSTVAAQQVHRSGELAGSYHLSASSEAGDVWWTTLGSTSRHARPVERGAWVSGRGPHMRGNFLLKKTVAKVYGAAMKSALPAGYRPSRTTIRTTVLVLK